MIAIIVENCAGCCFVLADEDSTESWRCDALQSDGMPRKIPERHVIDGRRWPPPPDWCPLRENDRLVTLRVK